MLRPLLLLILTGLAAPAAAQVRPAEPAGWARNAVTLDLGGAPGFMAVSYERLVHERAGVRIGSRARVSVG